MPQILAPTNPVPGYESNVTNRSTPVSPDTTQIQNITDPSRVVRADRQTDRQDNSALDSSRIRYDSNFQSFLQRLRETPDLARTLSRLFAAKEGTIVTSGMSEGLAAEMAKALQMLRMDSGQLLSFLSGQLSTGSRFGGALFALLRNAYDRASSEGVQQDILQFLKAYNDYSSSAHLEGNILRNLNNMADSMTASWAEKLRQLAAQLEGLLAAGDRKGALQLLQQEVFPHMASYVEQTHDMGSPRQFLSLLTLDMSRYENGSLDNMLQAFRRMVSQGTLKDMLGSIDDQSLLQLLKSSDLSRANAATQFADTLAAAALRALNGEGDLATQQIFQQLVGAMLVNESVYMPVNHYLIPLEWDGKFLFSELWVDPNAEQKEGEQGGGNLVKVLFKMDVQDLGLFDVLMTSSNRDVNLNIACPDKVLPHSRMIEEAMTEILKNNDLKPQDISVHRMEKPLSLTEVFPKIFEGKNNVNVKV